MLEEVKVLVKVEVLPLSNSIGVQWANQVRKDGKVIASTDHRGVYGAGMRDLFIVDLGADSVPYLSFVDWDRPIPDPLA